MNSAGAVSVPFFSRRTSTSVYVEDGPSGSKLFRWGAVGFNAGLSMGLWTIFLLFFFSFT
jgi:hypothetical protein